MAVGINPVQRPQQQVKRKGGGTGKALQAAGLIAGGLAGGLLAALFFGYG